MDAPRLEPAPAGARAFARAISLGLRALAVTWRPERRHLERLDPFLDPPRPALLAFWHGAYVPLFVLLEGIGLGVFIARSRRGSALARAVRIHGNTPVVVPASGGEDTLAAMRRALDRHGPCGIAVDGPCGPYHQVKRGVVELASGRGCPILPVSVASSSRFVLARRWDRLEVPLPRARVRLEIGRPLAVPGGLEGEGSQPWTLQLRRTMEALDRHLAARGP